MRNRFSDGSKIFIVPKTVMQVLILSNARALYSDLAAFLVTFI